MSTYCPWVGFALTQAWATASTIRKINENALNTSVSAISFGVRWRIAHSTNAIIRSRKEAPAPAVIPTTEGKRWDVHLAHFLNYALF